MTSSPSPISNAINEPATAARTEAYSNRATKRETGAPLRPLQVVVLFMFAATVGGGYLLLSAAESTTLVDGAVAWQANSPLRALVQTLCLNYEFPTINAGEVKNYILGIGAGLALLALTVAVLSRTRPGDQLVPRDLDDSQRSRRGSAHRGRFGALAAAQVLVGCYVLWSFASSRWSSAPPLAIGGSLLLVIFFLWSFCLGHSLGHGGARTGTRVWVAIGAVSAAIAVWYYYGRNPVISAKFPFGNPSFLATCLIPPIVLALAMLGESLSGMTSSARSITSQEAAEGPRRPAGSRGAAGRVVGIVAALLAIGICFWAFALSRSRGPGVGLVFAIIALWFFAARGKWKIPPAVVALACVAAGAWYMMDFANAASPTGRSASMRSRFFTWEYAWRMFTAKPFTGAGQGGFALHGDTYVAEDILTDPLAFVGRAAHAHNEWLEVLSDLGAVGLLLLGGALLLTLWASLHRARSSERLRWPLIGCSAALVGICAAECFGVGLRVAEVPTAFYSALGLVWAMCAVDPSPVLTAAAANGTRRVATGVLGGLSGLGVLALTQSDFSAAQSAYAAVELLKNGQSEQAVEAAADSVLRLSPQRVLENHYRLIQTHLAAAEKYMLSGVDRVTRATQVQPTDERLYYMAMQDLQTSDEHTTLASQQLKELVSRSPGYVDHGRLESRINLIRAESAATRGEHEARDAFIRNAAAAIEREMRRQPFDPDLAVEFGLIAGGSADPEVLLNVLARPLRHNRIGDRYVGLLEQLITQTDLEKYLDTLSEQERHGGTKPPSNEEIEPREQPVEPETAASGQQPDWRPEKLRLAAAAHFMHGDFEAAAADLGPACEAYEAMLDRAPIGASACFAELADAVFFSRPDQADPAIKNAQKAIGYAPESEAGRQLQSTVSQRMIHYFLAVGNEEPALTLLRKSAPPGVSEDDVQTELASRKRRMIESLVRTRRDWLASTDEGRAMLDKLDARLADALPRLKDDAGVRVLSVQFGILKKDVDRVAENLGRAMELGLSSEVAQALLQAAGEAGLSSPKLTILQQAVQGASDAAKPDNAVTPNPPIADEDSGGV